MTGILINIIRQQRNGAVVAADWAACVAIMARAVTRLAREARRPRDDANTEPSAAQNGV